MATKFTSLMAPKLSWMTYSCYDVNFPFLDGDLNAKILPGNNVLNLYKYVFSPDVGHSLAFIGFIQTTSSQFLKLRRVGSSNFAKETSNFHPQTP